MKRHVCAFAIAERLGYQPNDCAQSCQPEVQRHALIVPDISNPFFADISRSVRCCREDRLYDDGQQHGWDPAKEQERLQMMREQRVAGVIIKPTAFYKPGTFCSVNVPIVVFWHPADDEVTYIEVDHAAGARLAVTNLLERGFTRIGFLGGSETSPANKIRLMAYQKILQENGLRADRDWISFGGFRLESGYERIRKMLNSDNPPDAVFCGNDYIALGVLQYLREQKISVPDDFGLIGYDDIYFASLPMIQMEQCPTAA